MKLAPQQERVLNHLKKHGTIQPLEAWQELAVYRLSAVIFQLRAVHGFKIKTKQTTTLNRYAEKVSFATYKLEGLNAN